MIKIQCELCGSNELSKGADGFFVCDYCRTRYTPEQAKELVVNGTVRIDRSRDIDKLLQIAQHALESGNFQESYDYANRILEIDPELSNAWTLKGASAGRLSTLENVRISEMINSFESAIRFSSEDTKSDLGETLAAEAINTAFDILNTSVQYVTKNADSEGIEWSKHVETCHGVVNAYIFAYKTSSSSETKLLAIDNTIRTMDHVIEGVYVQPNNFGVKCTLPAHARKEWQEQRENAVGLAKELNPDFKPHKDGCFVITATLGSDTNIPVKILREFRDEILSKSFRGRRFIEWYYRNGPLLASHIETSKALRILSMIGIVIPATAIAATMIYPRKVVRSLDSKFFLFS